MRKRGKVLAVLRLTRAEHSVMLMVAVVAAELVAGGGSIPQASVLAYSLAAPALISMGAFAINDYFDVESDRANNRRDRPLVSGALNRREALYITAACMSLGLLAAFLISATVFVVALAFAALAALYSYRLKDVVLVGNAYIALTYAAPFIFGDLVVAPGRMPFSIVLICFVTFLSGLAREIHGMIRDHEGDVKARHSRNLVTYVGVQKAAYYAFILYCEAIAIGIVLFFYQTQFEYNPFAFNLVYLVPITVANLMLFYVAAVAALRPSKQFYGRSRNISLGAMGIALLAYLAASLFHIVIYSL